MRKAWTIALLCLLQSVAAATPALTSIDTGACTITKVRTAVRAGRSYIVASSYSGTVLAIGYDGKIRWTNKLSGFMNHDVCCRDITGDGNDEILAANADGSVYCISDAGKLLWTFKPNNAPMYSVCVVKNTGATFIACGGFDRSFYYLSGDGKLVRKVESRTYSKARTWGRGPKRVPPKGVHTVNFLRAVRTAGGAEQLAVHGVIHGMSNAGLLYLFDPPAGKPNKTIKLPGSSPFGELRACDIDGDGRDEVLLGASSMIHDAALVALRLGADAEQAFSVFKPSSLRRKIDRFGYRVCQPEIIGPASARKIMLLFGSRIILLDAKEPATGKAEVLACRYSFNDMWRDPSAGKIILASSQSGGSCIHVLDPSNPGWKKAYETLAPSGKIAAIIKGTQDVARRIADFKKPAKQRDSQTVCFMTESLRDDSVKKLAESLTAKYSNPIFLKSKFMPAVEKWDRSGLASEKYCNRRDRRKRYTQTGDQIVGMLKPLLDSGPGVSYWGGHGNDPYMISLATQKKIIDAAAGKKVVMIYPELEDSSREFGLVLRDHFFPLAEYCRGKNAKLYIRSKHLFWQTSAYKPIWSDLMSGRFADVFVPSMEETSDKSMELSLAARMGLWTSGVVDDWGARCARDNPSFDRLRQHSHQMLPNHFLRNQIYNIACGATYINNFPVEQKYMSVLWRLIAKGALYVPKRNEIVSISPVHVSMTKPDERFDDDGNNVKWTLFYDEKFDRDNPFVFGRLGGAWPGAPVASWDFSRYAAGVKDRRLGFLPPYPKGLVLITPQQKARGKSLGDMLHPLYRKILSEYVTDGRYYYSPDGKQKHRADSYYKTIEKDIADSSRKIPLTVSGDVAWVAAVSAPKHIRLTLVDSGYLNPSARTAVVKFNTVKPLAVTDVLSGQRFSVDGGKTARIAIPCGMFRFIDVEISERLYRAAPILPGSNT